MHLFCLTCIWVKTSTLLCQISFISENRSSSVHNLSWRITKDEGYTLSPVYCFQGLITFTIIKVCFLPNLNSSAFKYRFWFLLCLFNHIKGAWNMQYFHYIKVFRLFYRQINIWCIWWAKQIEIPKSPPINLLFQSCRSAAFFFIFSSLQENFKNTFLFLLKDFRMVEKISISISLVQNTWIYINAYSNSFVKSLTFSYFYI